MVTYTIYPIQPSGVARTFLAADLENDASAAAAAAAVTCLDENPSATQVMVWRDDKVVFSGLSRPCAVWLAGGAERVRLCPSVSSPGAPCPAACGRPVLQE